MSSFNVNEWSMDMNMDVIDVVTCPYNNDFHKKHFKVCFDIIDWFHDHKPFLKAFSRCYIIYWITL
jgi:hypothetical protein